MVGGEDGAGASLDAARPPCTLVPARVIQPHDGVLPDGIRVQRPTDEKKTKVGTPTTEKKDQAKKDPPKDPEKK